MPVHNAGLLLQPLHFTPAGFGAWDTDFAHVMKAEIGATQVWADFNVCLAADMLKKLLQWRSRSTTKSFLRICPLRWRWQYGSCRRYCGHCALERVIVVVLALAVPLACGDTAVLKFRGSAPSLA
ncbi:hypothetical protein [Sinorhizobium alkalisoli]|uniref:Uncharacterized protein n=2 Tax=Rhizobiaceae TaxID=82115 RepID=A0A1E3VHJ6_9HYPH|nr:hypothetical protein [Sinorhizobium alkalisoli]ODR92917.1 hypothetical protein A8M32_02550 [Sinorhizobium alkalisoli]